jgi:hypothetical protein
MSMGSVVSNIAKSALFGGVDESGRVQLHFPYEAVRLIVVDPESSQQELLRPGHVYFDGRTTDFDQFEDYHRIAEDIAQGITPQWESLDKELPTMCGCQCNNCSGCLGKKQLLPTANYVLALDETIYQRVMGEIADAQGMPCGLFFCGHHEDVAYPSIGIAVVIVTIFFAILMYLSFDNGILD